MSEKAPIAAAGVVCFRNDEVLLVRRGKPPREGEWSLPGGRIEWGERVQAAALRELEEETGVEAEIVGLVDVVDAFPSGAHFVLVDFAARWVRGEPAPGDDALEACFFPVDAIDALGLWAETARVIREARVLARG